MTTIRTLILTVAAVAIFLVLSVASQAKAEDLSGGNCPNARGICVGTACGDINNNGVVTVSDAQSLLYLIVGLAQPGDDTEYGRLCTATACNENTCYDAVIGNDGVCLFPAE